MYETDHDHGRYYRWLGTVAAIGEDGALSETSDERDAFIYSLKFEYDHVADFRWRDLRPGDDP